MNADSGALDNDLPIVTIFGAGIAGLTAAHELIERGFCVQIVERRKNDFEDYQCAVGGLAANQFARVRAPIQTLHPWLSDPAANRDLRKVETFRRTISNAQAAPAIEQTSERFPLRQKIRFDKHVHDDQSVQPPRLPPYDTYQRSPLEPAGDIPKDWKDYWDDHGTLNSLHVGNVLQSISLAVRTYSRLYFPAVAARLALGLPPTDAQLESGVIDGREFSPIAGNLDRARMFLARETLLVRIIGYTDTDGTAESNRRLAFKWATEVKDELIAQNSTAPADLRVWKLADHLEVVVRGSANPHYDQSTPAGRVCSNRVEFEVVEQVIPGEHGFRFFPAFYRHLFDTMRRTPILDASGNCTGRTAYDQLVPTPQSQLSQNDGKGPKTIDFRNFSSLRQLDDTVKMLMNDLKFTPRDLLGMEFYSARYATSCAERREREAEPCSTLTYLGGEHPDKRFSKAALDFINSAPRALAAMSATEADARTELDVMIQLMTAQSAAGGSDMTLDGPTSLAWLDHWKTYLRVQGVRFFVGEIESFDVVGHRMVPVVKGPDHEKLPRAENPYDIYRAPQTEGELPDYRFILATAYQQASDLVWKFSNALDGSKAAQFGGSFRQLADFDISVGRHEVGNPRALPPKRDPATGQLLNTSYPLRDISGLQYFFTQEYRFGEGNIYFVASPWALTSISQFAYWRDQIRPVGEYFGQISVDVGDWHAFYPGDRGNTAWYSSANEVALATWEQIKDGLATDYAQVASLPRYFHIDKNIVFEDFTHQGFQASASLRLLPHTRSSGDAKAALVTFTVRSDAWSRYNKVDPMVLSVVPEHQHMHKLATNLVLQINSQHSKFLFAVPVEGTDDNELLIAPKVVCTAAVIGFRGTSGSPMYLTVDDQWAQFTVGDAIDQRLTKLRGAAKELSQKLGTTLRIEPLDGKGHSSFRLTRDDGKEFRVGVANLDGVLELIDGPGFDVQTDPLRMRLIRPMRAGSGSVRSGAVRANAVIRVSPVGRDESAGRGVQPGRTYGIKMVVDGESRTVAYEAERDQSSSAVRNGLLQQLKGHADYVLCTSVSARERADGQPDDTPAGPGIVLSPIVDVARAVIRLRPHSVGEYRVSIDGHEITVHSRGKTPLNILEEIATRTTARVAHIEPESLTLVLQPDSPRASLKIGVINAHGGIELIGAPPLSLEVKDLYLERPPEGYVVLRNESEFLINVLDQWQKRPGLFRPNTSIPLTYKHLSACFGDTNPEIFYGNDGSPLTEYWFLAGTYMATHTRITTMEGANEAGRHAAAAIINGLLSAGDKGSKAARSQYPSLVGDFPQIWNIEAHEPDDLKFFKDLDRELFNSNLPHLFDILSITPLVTALLEVDTRDELIRPFLDKMHTTLSGLKEVVNRTVLSGGGAFKAMLDINHDLGRGVLDSITGTDAVSEFYRAFLADRLNELRRLIGFYGKMWPDP